MYPMVTIPKNTVNTEIISRQEIINWINKTLNFQYRRIEDLSSGGAYCMLMDILFPGCIGIRKIKVDSHLEHEMLSNYKCLQNAFRKYGVEKDIPIMNLIKGRFQDHLLFSQWFKRFYDANIRSNCDKNTFVSGDDCKQRTNASLLQLNKPIDIPERNFIPNHNSMKYRTMTNHIPVQRNSHLSNQKSLLSPELIGLRSELGKMKEEYEEDQQTIIDLSRERQFYYEKLCNIEVLCHEFQDTEYSKLVEKLQEILFKEEEGFVAPTLDDFIDD